MTDVQLAPSLAESDRCLETINLWPGLPPTRLACDAPEISWNGPMGAAADTLLLRNVTEPSLTVVLPAGEPNGVGIVICPGGGWRMLAWEHEGMAVARRLAADGYTGFVLRYRVRATPADQTDFESAEAQAAMSGPPPPTGKLAYRRIEEVVPRTALESARDAGEEDGIQALTLVRARAADWNIDPSKVGILGFSAGAFVAVDTALNPACEPPSFCAAIYGGDTDGRPVPSSAPPLFACVARDDIVIHRIVETLYGDWIDAGGDAELHIFRRGGHGFGLVKQALPSDRWIDLFRGWLADLGLR